MTMTKLRVIGDIHGHIAEYISVAKEADYSIQLGDLGFDYTLMLRGGLDPKHHKLIGGNHDNYRVLLAGQVPHYLGDYGVYEIPSWGEIFFVRGGDSIDKDFRIEGVDWFREEQLSMRECYKALNLYKQIKPKIVITHECPKEIIQYVGVPEWNITPSRTAQLLQSMFEVHQPEQWYFGHHHRQWVDVVNETTFICLPVMGFIDL